MPKSRSFAEDEVFAIDDSDGGTESDSDPCDQCGCPREMHDDGTGECGVCGECRRFKEPS
jgi:hypothetical protein